MRLSGMESQKGVGKNMFNKYEIEFGLTCNSSFS